MADNFQAADPVRFEAALARFDAENSRDPNREQTGGVSRPRELVYAQWLTDWVLRLAPEASEELRLAARAQHLCRCAIPRASYPATRAGYLKWREALKRFHAQKAGEILREVGYPKTVVERVEGLILKRHFPDDPDSRILEDGLCLVFLQHQFAELASRSSEEKMINALQKAWEKMTPAARRLAGGLSFGPREAALLKRAVKIG